MKKKVFRERYAEGLEEATKARRVAEKAEEEATDLFFKSLEEDLKQEEPKKRGRKKSVKSDK